MKEIVNLWPSAQALADDVGAKRRTVLSWRARGSIPAEYWLRVVRAAAEREYDVTLTRLARAAEERLS